MYITGTAGIVNGFLQRVAGFVNLFHAGFTFVHIDGAFFIVHEGLSGILQYPFQSNVNVQSINKWRISEPNNSYNFHCCSNCQFSSSISAQSSMV